MRALPLWVKLLGGIGLLAAACVALAFVPTGQVAYAPNAPIDMDGKVTIDGKPAEPLQGRMYLVGVTERPVNLLQRMLLDVGDPAVDFGDAPKGAGSGAPAAADVTSMDEAKQVAAGVAFEITGDRPEWVGAGATVAAVASGSPAAAVLRPGDIIVRVNGIDVDTSVDAGRIINKLPPGSRVNLGVRRAGESIRAMLRTAPPERGDTINRSRIGVALSTVGLRVRLPRDVSIDSGDVVGPSAGLAFALYLVDALSPDDLLRGRNVVASGALAPDGQVLAVGRVRQKTISAQAARRDLMLVPLANFAEARDAARDACGGDGSCVEVVPVRSVADAVELLKLSDAERAARIAAAVG